MFILLIFLIIFTIWGVNKNRGSMDRLHIKVVHGRGVQVLYSPINQSPCFELLRWCFAKEISLIPNISGDLGLPNRYSPKRTVRCPSLTTWRMCWRIFCACHKMAIFSTPKKYFVWLTGKQCKKTCDLFKTDPYKLELFSSGHLDSRIFSTGYIFFGNYNWKMYKLIYCKNEKLQENFSRKS